MTERSVKPSISAPPVAAGGAVVVPTISTTARKRGRYSPRSRRDKLILVLMVAIPTFFVVTFIVVPTILSIILSFSVWNGIGGIDRIRWVGLDNYEKLINYKQFWAAFQHNLIWLGWFLLVATPLGIFFAVILDRELRGSRFYQGALYLPVVLSLAIVGFIWQLQYAPTQGLINGVLGTNTQGHVIDWLGNQSLNLWAVLVAASWRQVGYVMILYLAGLKAFDPSLREAAQIDGANERQLFFRVVFPVLKPINIVVLVITIIESIRAFDLVYILNRGINGLELLSVLVTNTMLGESSRVGFGSAIAVVLLLICVGPIIIYLSRAMREENA